MSLWQTRTWQHMLKASGQIEQFFEVDGILVEKRQVSLWEFGLFVIGLTPRQSPSVEGEVNQGEQEELFFQLKELCQKQNCLFVQVETLSYNATPPQSPSVKGEFASGKYYKKFIPPHTAMIDLHKSEEEILAIMKPKGRYNIRLAEKKWVIVEQVEKNPYTIKAFFELMSETTSRDSFAGNSFHYYQTFLMKLSESQMFFAYFEGKIIAAAINVVSNKTMYYYYGASSSQNRNLMAPYLLQWTMICHAKKRGLELYDFLGIASPDELHSPLLGVTDFKLKLTPDTREVSQSFLWVHKKWKYRLIQLLKKIRP